MKKAEKRILVVEDEPAVRRVFSEALGRAGYEVDTAANGVEAEARLEEREYALYIIDIKMAEMDGMQLYQEMTEKYSGLLKRVIFTSGDVIGKDTELFLGRVGRPFLPKPFIAEELVAIVKETLESLED